MPDLESLLNEFSKEADSWFAEQTNVDENHAFIQDFFEPEHLQSAEWEEFQELGQHIYALQEPPIAYAMAFGEPNHPIEHYRSSFEYLAHGEPPLPERLDRLMEDPEVTIDHVKGSGLGELAGLLFAEEYQMCNDRAVAAAEAIGIETGVDDCDTPGAELRAFTEATEPVVEKYREIVGSRTEMPIRLEVDQFFNWLYQEREELIESGSVPEEDRDGQMRVWLLQPGRDAKFWDYWQKNDIVTIGWDELGDLRQYASRSDLKEQLSELDRVSDNPRNGARACLEFRDEMDKGDLVIIKRGTTELLGAGVIASDYRFEKNRIERNRNVRDVRWITTGEWTTPPRSLPRSEWDRSEKEDDDWRSSPRILPQKTLTEITEYDEMTDELEIRLGIDGLGATGRRERLPIDDELLAKAVEHVLRPAVADGLFEEGGAEHYVHAQIIPEAQPNLTPEALAENPVESVLSALDAHVNLLSWRELDDAKTLVEEEEPAAVRERVDDLLRGEDPVAERIRRTLEWGDAAEKGDLNGTVASYLLAMHAPATHAFCKPSVYIAGTTALLGSDETVFAQKEAERIVHATRFYGDVLRRLRHEHDLPLTDLMHVHSLFYMLSELTDNYPTWTEVAMSDGDGDDPPHSSYTVDDATDDLFHAPDAFRSWLRALRTRKNVILQGPPGVGKTFVARRLAYALMGRRDDDRIRMVQFHQSYAYEDFIRGFRPSPDGDFQLQDGVFYRFCRRAQQDPDRPYVFLIDEINRGNLSKIFGELMMLIEPDKRGPDHAVPLTYQSGRDADFYVPENLHLIGMMNTADRSLAMVDYALRRRFRFIDMEPKFNDRFEDHLRRHDADAALIDRIVDRLGALNDAIRDDTNLGPGFRIGHSYFCPRDGETVSAEWYERIVEQEIAPLLREYWFDARDTAESHVNALLE